jgi:[ribosomal protein S18]-alanine N-acetyltransferase
MQAQDLDRVLMLAAESSEAPRWVRGDYEQILLPPPQALLARCALVALCADSLVGFAVASWLPQETFAELESVVVHRDHRRRGIGSTLLAACMAWAANAGASTLRLEVRASNAAALALYQRHGFSTTGVRRAYYSAPLEDALLLQAPLFPL